jgi:hypothetical protein
VHGLNGDNGPDSSWRAETERALEELDNARIAMLDAYQAAEMTRADFEQKREAYLKRIQSMPMPVALSHPQAALPKKVSKGRTGPRNGRQRVLDCLKERGQATLDQISEATGLGRGHLKNNLLPQLQQDGKVGNHLGDWSLTQAG